VCLFGNSKGGVAYGNPKSLLRIIAVASGTEANGADTYKVQDLGPNPYLSVTITSSCTESYLHLQR
jgi:hypothetical protein